METPEVIPATETEEAEAPASSGPAPAPEPQSAADKKARRRKATDRKRIVKVLSVGMEVPGRVKHISDFGAFVDIGVGRDGLLHISEMSVKRVKKVTDVVNEGDQVTVWIKELDRDKNRISLTMVPPGTRTVTDLVEGELVTGTVQRLTDYGAFVDIGYERDAMLHVREMADGYVAKPADVVKVGDEIEARVIEVDRRQRRIALSLKGLGPATDGEGIANQEGEVGEPEEEEALPTMMELAFRDAFGGADGLAQGGRQRSKSGRERRRGRAHQDDIIARTLRYGDKGA